MSETGELLTLLQRRAAIIGGPRPSVRATSDGGLEIRGYGSVFNNIDSYGDRVAPGAFHDTLKEMRAVGRMPLMLLQHGSWFSVDDLVPIGEWLEMREDDYGLRVRGRLFDVETDRTRATAAALRSGALDGLSIGFFLRKYSIDNESGIRILTQIDLFELSVVSFPANAAARIESVKQHSEMGALLEQRAEMWR